MVNARAFRLTAALMLAVGAIAFVTTNGDDQSSLLFEEHPDARGVAADRAFVELMVPELRVRIALAKAARGRAYSAPLRAFAARSVRRSRRESRLLLKLAPIVDADIPRGFSPPPAQGRADSGVLGLVAFDAGLAVRPSRLPSGGPLDEAFLNRIIRLDQGAIRMARAIYKEGHLGSIRRVANAILFDRFDEVLQLNRWYLRWYDRPSKAGGIPSGA